jgi:two-component system sensor histidine kinase/response regulator
MRPHGSDLLKADRLKAGGIKPGTWALNGIIGLTELVLDSPLTAEQSDHLGFVKSSADSLLALVTDLLEFAEIERDQAPVAPTRYAVRECLDDALRALVPHAREKGIMLSGAVRPEVPETLIGDALHIRQILSHLIGNALKFTKRGAVTVDVGLEMPLRDGVLLHFAVADTGIGISPEQQLVIFDAFTQADGSSTRRYGGIGLGLTIAARIVARMEGRIWVNSELGTGSKFHFTCRQRRPRAPRRAARRRLLAHKRGDVRASRCSFHVAHKHGPMRHARSRCPAARSVLHGGHQAHRDHEDRG